MEMETISLLMIIGIFFGLCLVHLLLSDKCSQTKYGSLFLLTISTCFFSSFYYFLESHTYKKKCFDTMDSLYFLIMRFSIALGAFTVILLWILNKWQLFFSSVNVSIVLALLLLIKQSGVDEGVEYYCKYKNYEQSILSIAKHTTIIISSLIKDLFSIILV